MGVRPDRTLTRRGCLRAPPPVRGIHERRATGAPAAGIFAHDRDIATGRALAFDAFDTMKGLAIVDLFEGCKLGRAEQVLASLEEALPSEVSDLLLLPARRAVQALRVLQAGFLPSRVRGQGIRLPDRTGGYRLWSTAPRNPVAVALQAELVF